MFGFVVFWLFVAFTVVWTLGLFVTRDQGRVATIGTLTTVVFFWAVIVVFFACPQFSRLHLLWVVPIAYGLSALVGGLVIRVFLLPR